MKKNELFDKIEELENKNEELLQKLSLKTIEVSELKRIYTMQINSLYDRLSNPCIYLNDGTKVALNSLNEEQLQYLSNLSDEKRLS